MLRLLERARECRRATSVVEFVGRKVSLGLSPIDPVERAVDPNRHGAYDRTGRAAAAEHSPRTDLSAEASPDPVDREPEQSEGERDEDPGLDGLEQPEPTRRLIDGVLVLGDVMLGQTGALEASRRCVLDARLDNRRVWAVPARRAEPGSSIQH